MSYDSTGPVKVNETKSLVLLVLLVGLVAGGIWVALRVNHAPPSPPPFRLPPLATAVPGAKISPATGSHPKPKPRVRTPMPRNQLDTNPDGITHPRENVMVIKAGAVYVTITSHKGGKPPTAARTRPRNDKHPVWVTFNAVQRILSDPNATKPPYDVTPEQLAALKGLHLKVPELTEAEQKMLGDLYEKVEAANGSERTAAEKELVAAARKMVISPQEEKAFEEEIEKAREILRPDQLDLIDRHD